MRDVNRIGPMLELLERAWRKQPDLRLAQLILNLATESDSLYQVEDAELAGRIKIVYLGE